MSKLEGWVQRRLAALLLWLLAGGYIMLLAELVITSHLDGVQLVAVGASAIGLVLTLTALAVGRNGRYIIAVLLLILSVTGLLGTYQHYEARAGEGDEAAAPAYVAGAPANQSVALRAQAEAEDEGEAVPPPLAPLSLSGLSLMAALATLGLDKARG